MTAYVLPAGFPLGPRWQKTDPPARTPEAYEIHLADDMPELTEEEYLAYTFASRDLDRHSRLAYDRRRWMHDMSRDLPGTDAELLADTLIARGAVVEIDPDGDLRPVFRRHRLFPTGHGMGGTPEDPWLHTIAVGGEPVARLTEVPHTVWAFSFLYPNLWEACEDMAEHDRADHDGGYTVAEVARQVAEALPAIIVTRSGYLDPLMEPE